MHILHCVDAQDMAGAGRAPEIALMSGKTVYASDNIVDRTAGSRVSIMAC